MIKKNLEKMANYIGLSYHMLCTCRNKKYTIYRDIAIWVCVTKFQIDDAQVGAFFDKKHPLQFTKRCNRMVDGYIKCGNKEVCHLLEKIYGVNVKPNKSIVQKKDREWAIRETLRNDNLLTKEERNMYCRALVQACEWGRKCDYENEKRMKELKKLPNKVYISMID